MPNNTLEYLSALWSVVEGMDSIMDSAVFDADDGENTSMDEGKQEAISQTDAFISTLTDFKTDINKLSLRKLKQKYN